MAGVDKQLTALVVGSTGLVGGVLVNQLLDDGSYDKVITLSRKRTHKNSTKFKNYLADLFDPETYREELRGDHLFICTGTTQAKTPDQDEYYRIEHDLPLTVAGTALENGIKTVVAVSALGADPESRFRYNRGKGEMERDIEALGFEDRYFVQPALIGGQRDERRPFESAWKRFQGVIDPLLVGFLKKYRIIEPDTIAQSMIYLAKHGYPENRIESDQLKKLARLERN
jgi:uncharacterized protein YbjT (DUF2867 family)